MLKEFKKVNIEIFKGNYSLALKLEQYQILVADFIKAYELTELDEDDNSNQFNETSINPLLKTKSKEKSFLQEDNDRKKQRSSILIILFLRVLI